VNQNYIHQDNIAGVKIPVFRQFDTGLDNMENIGLGGGGRKIAECKEKFGALLAILIKLASLQTSCVPAVPGQQIDGPALGSSPWTRRSK
jgi:vacuolar-type H+-ATPase subunit D/Vma8